VIGIAATLWIMRRAVIALLASLALHGATLVAGFGWAAWQGVVLSRKVEFVTMNVTEVKELPLGPAAPLKPAASPARGPSPEPSQLVKVRRKHAPARAKTKDAGTSSEVDAGPHPKYALGDYGPEGSKLTALLRLDRLRVSPQAERAVAAMDEVLKLLPDRHQLLEGTGLDLYRDFNALLIATPNPRDANVTFIAARHGLGDDALRSALDLGAAATGRIVKWRTDRGRPVGVRQPHPDSVQAETGADTRIFILPAPGLAVIAPRAYGELLLSSKTPKTTRDGGATAADGKPGASRIPWTELIARIDAEDSVLPESAVLAITASHMFRMPSGRALSVPVGECSQAPSVISLLVTLSHTSSLELHGTFETSAEARACAALWPTWRQTLLGNPLFLMSGLDAIVARTTVEQDGGALILRTSASTNETRQLLQMVVDFARSTGQRRQQQEAAPPR
jgi:hypothetical protein